MAFVVRRRASTLLAAVIVFALAAPAAGQRPGGKAPAPESYSLPQWFRPSLLEFPDEVADARKRGRHVMVFLHLDDCPYCARMLRDNFTSGENREFMGRHFEVVAINIRGDQEVKWIDGKAYTERTLARHLKVVGTPTIVFLGQEGGVALRLDGYREPRAFRAALEYVQSGDYRRGSFAGPAAARK